MNPQILEQDGHPVFVVLPMTEWKALLQRLEELQDQVDARQARQEESLPLDFVERRLAGESPLRLWRELRGLTLQVLAERVGCSRQMLSQIERRKTVPSTPLLFRLAQALQVDMDDLHEVVTI
jgi:DNA-binding XRE family transcriptional regulator